MKNPLPLYVGLVALSVVLGAVGTGRIEAVPQIAPSSTQAAPRLQADFGKMPLYFIENRGQVDARVGYYVQGKDKAVYFGTEGLTFALSKASDKNGENALLKEGRPFIQPAETDGAFGGGRWIVKLDFVGANPDVRPVGMDETGAVISYFQGAKDDWKTGLSTYSRIVYRELWPGIDLVYRGTADRLKAEYIVKPGADPSLIRMAYRGAESVSLTAEGRLEIATPISSFQDDVPVAWQEADGVKREVAARYALEDPEIAADGSGQTYVYGFHLDEYDASLPLTLDPAVLVYCGYIGGVNQDLAFGLAVDRGGSVYFTGLAESTEASFPVAVGPDLTYTGSFDAFVAKINAAGTALDYCGYIGGISDEYGMGIAVDGAGNAYIIGATLSTQTSFPVTVGPDLTYNGGYFDAFVAKVNPSGTELIYCGYLGGSSEDFGRGIAVDSGGNAFVTGQTYSPETSFPAVVGPDLTQNGYEDAFVAKVNPAGTSLVYCGYIGGVWFEYGADIAVDGAGNAYITGRTSSEESSFPAAVGPDLTHNGGDDAFVAKVNPAGTALVYCGYIGGTEQDRGNGIALDSGGSAYVTGATQSPASSFPVAGGPDLTHNGLEDAFVAKVNPAGTALVYCGYIGTSNHQVGQGIAVDGGGNAYVAGFVVSADASFPVVDGPDLTYNGDFDAFVAKVNPAGTSLVYCGFIGGSAYDVAEGIAVDGGGNAYVAGYTQSTEASFPVVGGPDLTFNGSYDVFVAKISTGGALTVTSPNGGEQWAAGSQHPITWLSGDKAGANKIVYSTDKGATWKEIVFSTPDDEFYLWTVPDDLSNTVWVRVAEREGPGYDRSNTVFSIVPPETVTVISPNGGESWLAGTAHTIKWSTTGTVGPVRIGYSTDNGLNWTTIAAGAPNSGSYTWVVPNKPSAQCKVRVRGAADNIPSDATNGTFTIRLQQASHAKKRERTVL